VTAQTKINGIPEIKLALERRQFADIIAASDDIQSRLLLQVPLAEADCALLAGALFARAAALVCYKEYSDSRHTAQRALRTMCALGPETVLIAMIQKAVDADFAELASLAEAATLLDEWLRSTSLDTERRRALQRSLHTMRNYEPLQAAITIALMRDLVELVEEWARVSAARFQRKQDGSESPGIEPAHWATAAGLQKRTTTLYAIRSRGGNGDTPLISVSVGMRPANKGDEQRPG
jgi:predicted fused transcriptional regulator/phosphomethylpyrimidine kinase